METFQTLPNPMMGKAIRNLATRTGVSFAIAAACYTACGGNVAKAAKMIAGVRR